MIGLEIITGAAITFLIQWFKKLSNKVGGSMALIITWLVCATMAWIWTMIKDTGFVAEMGVILGSQYVTWGLFIKYIYPQIKSARNKEIKTQ